MPGMRRIYPVLPGNRRPPESRDRASSSLHCHGVHPDINTHKPPEVDTRRAPYVSMALGGRLALTNGLWLLRFERRWARLGCRAPSSGSATKRDMLIEKTGRSS